ncbi:MAG: type II toxin-antitoxin system Phd/YefM family antitoxin [Pseudomonadota bacterium]|nr:type II toxin-antitoxin system Phd/YefM family antitoxin [Pseudomonadota bacterium]
MFKFAEGLDPGLPNWRPCGNEWWLEVRRLWQKQFGRYSDEAMIRPVGVSRNGRVRFVMVPIDEYERLRRRERVAGRVEDLDDETLDDIRAAEQGRGSGAAEKRLNAF